MRDFAAELQAARDAQDWAAHERIWEERRFAEVAAQEAAIDASRPVCGAQTEDMPVTVGMLVSAPNSAAPSCSDSTSHGDMLRRVARNIAAIRKAEYAAYRSGK